MTPLVVCYLRVSGAAQVEGDGFERQTIACQNYANTHNLTVARTFREEGVSGKTDLDFRPALQELLITLEGRDNCIILVEKLDRLARHLMVQESILADFQRRGHTIISAMEPDLCSDDPTRTLMRQMLGAFAQYERSMIVSKLRGARQRIKSRIGRCEGVYAFGHDPKRPDEGLTLAAIIAQRRAGTTCQAVADYLNGRRVPTRSGMPWRGTTIAKIVRREQLVTSKPQSCA